MWNAEVICPKGVGQGWDKGGTRDKSTETRRFLSHFFETRNYNLFIYLYLSVPVSQCFPSVATTGGLYNE
jgi:hypothetical protein